MTSRDVYPGETSVLAIVNTKDAAFNIFRGISDRLNALNYKQVQIQQGLRMRSWKECAKGCRRTRY